MFDPMEKMCWEFPTAYYKNGKHCAGCNDAGEEYEFPAGDLVPCKSGFCRGAFCRQCVDTNFENMAEEWHETVLEDATGLVGLEPQREQEGSEDYNPEYLRECLVDVLRWEAAKRMKGWCVSCFLVSHQCDSKKCEVRAMVNRNCMGPTHKSGGQRKRKREVETAVEVVVEGEAEIQGAGESSAVSYAVDKCIVTQGVNKKMRITIDLTAE